MLSRSLELLHTDPSCEATGGCQRLSLIVRKDKENVEEGLALFVCTIIQPGYVSNAFHSCKQSLHLFHCLDDDHYHASLGLQQ